MVVSNQTDDVNFNPETAQSGNFVSGSMTTQMLITYQKSVSLNGTGQDQPYFSTSTSFYISWSIEEMYLGFQIASFDVVTISEVTIMSWKQYIISHC